MEQNNIIMETKSEQEIILDQILDRSEELQKEWFELIVKINEKYIEEYKKLSLFDKIFGKHKPKPSYQDHLNIFFFFKLAQLEHKIKENK